MTADMALLIKINVQIIRINIVSNAKKYMGVFSA